MIWQPIETAPKDGTEILAWGKMGSWGPGWMIVRYRQEKPWFGPCMWEAVIGGWAVYQDSQIEDDPIHWMPLPDPPQPRDR